MQVSHPEKVVIVSQKSIARIAIATAVIVVILSYVAIFQVHSEKAELVEVTKALIVENEKLKKQLDEALVPQATVTEAMKAGVQSVWDGIKNIFN